MLLKNYNGLGIYHNSMIASTNTSLIGVAWNPIIRMISFKEGDAKHCNETISTSSYHPRVENITMHV